MSDIEHEGRRMNERKIKEISVQGAERKLRGCIGCEDRLSCVMLVCDVTLDEDGVPTCWTAPKPVASAPETSCLLCTEHDTCQYQGPETCGDFVRKIAAPVQPATSEEKDCPLVFIERFADNGAHSHWAIVVRETGEEIATYPSEDAPVQSTPSEEDVAEAIESLTGPGGRAGKLDTVGGDIMTVIDAYRALCAQLAFEHEISEGYLERLRAADNELTALRARLAEHRDGVISKDILRKELAERCVNAVHGLVHPASASVVKGIHDDNVARIAEILREALYGPRAPAPEKPQGDAFDESWE